MRAISGTLPPVYYLDGATVYAAYPDGSGATPVVTLAVTPTVALRLLPDGRLLYPTAGGFAVVDTHGQRYPIRTPDLQPGESVWSVTPSPDGSTLAWQLFTPAQLSGYNTNAGATRIVLTGRFGDPGAPVFSAQADANNDGQLPIVLGWRPSSPYGTGDATLLLQDLYSGQDPRSLILPNSTRGLLEYDPAIRDIVNDYLPPITADIPMQRAFSVSTDGHWAVYGDSHQFTPSGEGPLARSLAALNLNTNAVVHLDDARNYPISQTVTSTYTQTVKQRITVRKGGRLVTHTVTKKVKRKRTTMLRLYQYFSHHAYVAPGDGRVLYTLLTVSYPPGARVPRVQSEVLVATMDGRTRGVVTTDAVAEGWLDGHVAVVKTAGGLNAVNAVFGGGRQIAAGGAAQLIGVRS